MKQPLSSTKISQRDLQKEECRSHADTSLINNADTTARSSYVKGLKVRLYNILPFILDITLIFDVFKNK